MLGGIGLGYGAGEQIAQNISASVDAARANAKARSVQEMLRMLEDRIDKLILANMAMWELIKERTDLTESDLATRISEIDLRDGKADGKMTRTVKKCGKCGKTMSARHNHCLYCGAVDLAVGNFETI